MDQWLEEIRAALPELVVYQQEPMKKHTTFRVGGPADLYELDWLIYNAPAEYADLVLNGDPVKYLKTVTVYKPFEN